MSWSIADSEGLARGLLSKAEDRWAHVQLVAHTLDQMLEGRPNHDLLVSAGWLHDIGYAAEVQASGLHAVDGAAFLERAELPATLVSLVAFHTGAEFEAEERGLAESLFRFNRPAQEDLDLLILADLLSDPTGKRVTIGERLEEIPTRYGRQHPVHRAVLRSRPYLERCAARAGAFVAQPM